MAIPTKSIDQAAKKWVARAGVAGQDFKDGVAGAGTRWAANASAASQNFADGVTAAIGRGAYAKGIQKAGPTRYENKAIEKGGPRYAQGVALGLQDYTQRMAPYLSAIAGITLPPRGPSGDPRNYLRIQAIGEVLSKMRKG